MKKITLSLLGLLTSMLVFSQTFTPLNSGTPNTIGVIYFVNDDIGFATNGTTSVLSTIDGGANWTIKNSGFPENLGDVAFVNANTGYIIGANGQIIKTTDGGTTWTKLVTHTTSSFSRIWVNGNDIYVSGYIDGNVYKSSDAGVTWTPYNTGLAPGAGVNNLYGICFGNATTGYVVGLHGIILKTTDAGLTWTSLNSGTTLQLLGVWFTDANNGYAVGGDPSGSNGIVLKTTNGGATWTQTTLPNNYFGNVRFLNANVGYVSGGNSSANTSTILKTCDAGVNWTVLPTSSNRQFGASFPSMNTGYTSGLNGTILKMGTVVNSATICAGANVVLTASGANTYTWSPSTGLSSTTGASVTANPTVTTTYTVTGTSGCTSSNAVSKVTVNPSPIVNVNSATVCVNNSATLTASGAASYVWNTGALTNPITVTPTTTTSYTVTGTDVNGCKGTATSTVIVNPLPIVSVNSATVCANNSAILTASGAASYVWNTGALTNPITVTPTTTTSYTVTGTDVNGCKGTATSTVTIKQLPVIVDNAQICEGQSTDLIAGVSDYTTAGDADSYSWSLGVTVKSKNIGIVSPIVTTQYTVTAFRNGCSNTAVSTVTVKPAPAITVNSATICQGGSATLTATGAYTYLWSTGATTDAITVSPTTTTSYTVTGKSKCCSCAGNAVVTTVTVKPLPVVTVNSATICAGDKAYFEANGADTYTWSSGVTQTGVNTAIALPNASTSYTVTGSVNGCSSTAVANVTVPFITVSSATICQGQTATLTATGAASYTWSNGATTSSITVSLFSTTSYTVTGTVKSCIICSARAIAKVTVLPLPQVTIAPVAICNGNTATLTASGASTYLWNTGAVTNSINVSPTVTTTYSVTGTSAAGCSNTATGKVTVNPKPNVTVNSATICNRSSASLTANGANVYTWSPSTGLSATTGITVVASPTVTTTYIVTGTSAAGCNNTATAKVTVNPSPNISIITGSCNFGCTLHATGAGTGGSYAWYRSFTPSGPWSPYNTGQTIIVPSGFYYAVVGTDINGCTNILGSPNVHRSSSSDESFTVNPEAVIDLTKPTSGEIILYPNPNNGNMTLNYSMDATDKGVFTIYDLLGQVIAIHLIDGTNRQLEINNDQLLNNGTYIYSVIINGNEVKRNKIVIVK